MTFFLDTNVIIDVISKREGYENSLKILRCCELNRCKCFISGITITDVMFILRKHSPETIKEAVQTLLLVVDITDVLKSDVINAFSNGIKDYEDAVQSACAKRINADYIVTNNIKDFVKSHTPAITPRQAAETLLS